MNININKRLTGEGRGGIIRPMKSRNQRRIARGLARLLQGARVGTVIARQNPCQLRGLATPDRAIFSVIFTPKSLDRPPHYRDIITLLIRWANQLNKDDNMSKYTPTMIEGLRNAQPLNLAKAQTFASEWGVSYRSIIAKALSLGLTYEKKTVTSSSSNPTKKDLVAEIERALDAGESLTGLEGASMRSLSNLLMSIG